MNTIAKPSGFWGGVVAFYEFIMRQVAKLLRWANLDETPQGVNATVYQLFMLVFVYLFVRAAIAVAGIQSETYELWLPGAGIVGACVFVLQLVLVEQAAERAVAENKEQKKKAYLWGAGAALCAIVSVGVMMTAQERADRRRVAEANELLETRKALKADIDELKLAPEMYAMSSVKAAQEAYSGVMADMLPDGRTIGQACITPTRAVLQDCARLTSARQGISDARKRKDTEAKIAEKEALLKSLEIPDEGDLDLAEVRKRRLLISAFMEIVMAIGVAFIGFRRGQVSDVEGAVRAAQIASGASKELNAAADRAATAAEALKAAQGSAPGGANNPAGVWVDLGGNRYKTPAGVELSYEEIERMPGLLERLQAAVRQGTLRKA